MVCVFRTIVLVILCLVASRTASQSWQPVATPSQAPVLAFADSPSGGIIAAVSGSGIYKSLDYGTTWTSAGNSGFASLEIHTVLYVGSTLYAGTHNGVYKSADDGQTWMCVSKGLPLGYGSFPTVFKLAAAPDGTIYAGTESGVYKTANSAVSWTKTATLVSNGATVRALFIDSAGTIYAGTTSGASGGAPSAAGSVYISRDGGTTWSGTGIREWSIRAITMDTRGRLFAGAWATPYTSGGLYSSADGGITWSLVLPNVSVNVVYCFGSSAWVGTRDAVLYRANNYGTIFNVVPSSAMAVFAIHRVPNKVFLGSNGIYRSLDNGVSWSQANSGISMRGQVSQLLFLPDGSIYARSMLFGIVRSFDGGLTWSDVNAGLNIKQGRTPQHNEIFLNAYGEVMAARDSKVYRLAGNGNLWVMSNLSAQILVTGNTLTGAGEILVSDQSACVYRSTDGGSTFTGCTSKISPSGGIVFKLLTAPDGVIYAGLESGGVYMSTDNGYTWSSMGLTSTGNLYSIAITPGGMLLAASAGTNGLVYRYTGNSTWVRSDTGIIGSDAIYALTATPSGEVVAAGNLGVYISADGQNWTNCSTGIPRLSRTYTEEIRPQFPVVDSAGYMYFGFSYEGYGIYRSLAPMP